MLLTISIVMGFKKEITGKITGLTTDIIVSSPDLNSGESSPIKVSEDTLKLIRELPFTKYVQKTAFKNGLLKTDTENEGVVLKGVTSDYDFSFLEKHLLEGRLPEFKEDEASRDILVSESLCRKMDLKLSQKIQVYFLVQHEVHDSISGENFIKSEQRSRSFNVCGIFKTDFSDFDDKLSLIDLRQIQNLNYWSRDMAGKLELRIKDFEKLEQNQEELEELLGYNYSISNVKEVYSNIFIWLDKLDINGVIIVVLLILVSTVNMITALLILILERTNMVGLVKALGMNNADVRKIFLNVSYRLIGKGMLWGNIIGIGLCLLQYHFKIAKLDSETYYVDFVAIDINWYYFLLLNVGAFIACALMLFLPSLIITRLTPIRTLKFD